MYRIAGNFGEVFNLANWQFSGKPPNLQSAIFYSDKILTNIASLLYVCVYIHIIYMMLIYWKSHGGALMIQRSSGKHILCDFDSPTLLRQLMACQITEVIVSRRFMPQSVMVLVRTSE